MQITKTVQAIAEHIKKQKSMVANSGQNLSNIIDEEITSIQKMRTEMQNLVDESSSAVEEMSASISRTSVIAKKTDNYSKELSLTSEKNGNQAMKELTLAIEDVSNNSEKIVDIVRSGQGCSISGIKSICTKSIILSRKAFWERDAENKKDKIINWLESYNF